MARSRNIKPGFFTNDDLGELDPLARLLFAGMWTIADRSGRLEDRPKKIKAEVLPYDNCDAEAFLTQLAERGFILRYEAGGKRFIQVLAWGKHQNPHCKEAPSTIPAPDGHTDETEATPDKHGASTVQTQVEQPPLPEQAGLIPDSLNLIPDSLVSVEPKSAKPRAARKCPDSFVITDDLKAWAQAECPVVDLARETAKFRDHTFKTAISDWPATWRNWMRKASDYAQPPRASPPETPYAAHMRQRVEQAAGSMAHIVAAKPPGQKPKEPWEVAADEQRTIEDCEPRAIAIGMG